jgi:hypothetical protein
MLKVVEVIPGGTTTFEGTVAALLLEVMLTVVPDGPAGPLRVSVPVEAVPPRTLVGFRLIPVRDAGSTVRLTVMLTPGYAVTCPTMG